MKRAETAAGLASCRAVERLPATHASSSAHPASDGLDWGDVGAQVAFVGEVGGFGDVVAVVVGRVVVVVVLGRVVVVVGGGAGVEEVEGAE